jgi:8-oxo-dGTP pyrophosphatase MutT (NUDIX family)
MKCHFLKPLLTYQQGMDVFHTPTYLFYTEDFSKQSNFSPCAGEIESIEWIPLTKCIEMITSGEIVNSFTIIALLAYQLKTQ